jgi:N-acetylneuraminic acid mutarotase
MYELGGIYPGGYHSSAAIARMVKFDSTQGTWSQSTHMPACAIGGDIYVFGGSPVHSQDQASVFKFDTVTDTWSTLAPMPLASSFHSASVLGGLVYIVGIGVNCCEVLRFDPALDAWSTLAPTSSNRKYGVSFVVGGRLYVAGGSGRFNLSVERYHMASNTWTIMSNMHELRGFFGAVTIGSVGSVEQEDIFDSLIAKASRGPP